MAWLKDHAGRCVAGRSRPHLFSQDRPHPARHLFRAHHARTGGSRDSRDRRLAARSDGPGLGEAARLCHSAPVNQGDTAWRTFRKIPTDEGDLKRSLGPIHLIALGIGCIIGAGIFVLTGQAAATYAGPGVVISFAIAGLGCLFAGLCYSEFASMIPVAGSAYTYTYATLGQFVAWIIGWNLVLEYLAASSTVAVGWSGYFNDFMSAYRHADPRHVRRRAHRDAEFEHLHHRPARSSTCRRCCWSASSPPSW